MTPNESNTKTAPGSPLTLKPSDVRWVVNDMGELGVEINGQTFFCYKGESLSYKDPFHDDESPILYRQVGKREFGETVWPMSWHRAGRSEPRYTEEVIFHEGLSAGFPDDPAYQWKPLSAPAQTDTPRTEKAFDDWNPHDGSLDEIWEHARQLERELSHAVKVAGEALERLTSRKKELWAYDEAKGIGLREDLDFAEAALSDINRIKNHEH